MLSQNFHAQILHWMCHHNLTAIWTMCAQSKSFEEFNDCYNVGFFIGDECCVVSA